METAKNILQLRQQLAERFPQLRTAAEALKNVRDSQMPRKDSSLGPWQTLLERNKIVELVQADPSSGSALLLGHLIRHHAAQHWVALIDGSDSFSPFDDISLPRFLWVRCQNSEQALKAADLLLRDGNVSFVLLDLAINPLRQLRKIPPTTWYRLQRIVHHHATGLLVIVPSHLISCAESKWTLSGSLPLAVLSQPQSDLLPLLKLQTQAQPAEAQFA